MSGLAIFGIIVFMVVKVLSIILPALARGMATNGSAPNNYADYVGKTAEELYDMGITNQEMLREQMQLNDMQMQQLMDQQFQNDMQMQQFMDQQFQNDMQFNQFMNDMQNQHFMDESLKFVTPFEHGGYDLNQGNSFNNFGFGDCFGGGFGGGCGMF